MDAAFLLDEPIRVQFFRSIMQSFGCTYICLWSYFPHPSNCLFSLDGYYNEEDDQPIAQRLFNEYRQSVIPLENDGVPGLAFRNNRPYIEIRGLELQRMASIETQRRFYQEARIQIAAFMGCRSGEIELGLSNNTTQINMEMGMREWFPEDFARQSPVGELPQLAVEQNRPSSSSSSLRSLDSPSDQYSPLIFNIPTASQQIIRAETTLAQVPSLMQQILPITTTSPIEGAMSTMQALRQIGNIQLPIREGEDAALTRAYLAVLTSLPSTSSSSLQQQQQQQQQNLRLSTRATAFKRYGSTTTSVSLPSPRTPTMRTGLHAQSMLKRAISYYQRLSILRREQMLASRPTSSTSQPAMIGSTQLHHMISERRRREKLNDSFQALRSLLPPGTKRDKASLLISTREYLTSLNAQITDLIKRNQQLEAQLKHAEGAAHEDDDEEASGSITNERLNVRVTPVSESTSEERIIDLRVIVRGECPTLNLVIRLLEFLKQVNNVSLMSMEARTQITGATSFNHVNLRLKIEGEWDESAFQEAVRRVVDDLAQ